MKALIIDDTRLARQELQFLLRDAEDVDVVAEAENADEAAALIKTHAPDLLFLDIEMDAFSGIDLGHYMRKNLGDERTGIVYISWERRYAMGLRGPVDHLSPGRA